jgi:signal transduction histidine kinase/PAS domain-containing protein
MKNTIAKKLIAPMVGIILIAALVVSWSYSWVQERHRRSDARHDVEIFQENLVDSLALIHDQLMVRISNEMDLLRSESRRMGVATQGGMLKVGGQSVPDIRFGKETQAMVMTLAAPRSSMPEGSMAIFGRSGADFICLSSHGLTGLAVGSVLEPASAPCLALREGLSYWGPAALDGATKFTLYEPVRNAQGVTIGAFGIEYPMASLTTISLAIHRAWDVGGVVLALLDPQGRAIFAGGTMDAAAFQSLLKEGRVGHEPWIVSQQAFTPWGVTVLGALPTAGIRQEVWMIRWGALVIALALAGVLTLSYYLVLRRSLLQPLGDVLGVLGVITFYKQYDLRFESRFQGEVAVLTQALNEMLDQIKARDTQLLSYQEHLEELVAQRLDQLLQAKQLLTATLDAMPARIAILDGAGAILVTNQQWQRTNFIHPFIAGAQVGMDYLALIRTAALRPEHQRIAEGITEVVEGRQEQVQLDYDVDLPGQHHWFNVMAIGFSSRDTHRAVVMHIDVTEQRLMEIQLRQAQKLESIGQLASGIAHEINTPTQYIGDNTIFLRQAFQSLADLVEPLERVLEGASHGECPPELLRTAREALDRTDLDWIREEAPRAFSQSLEGIRRVSTIVSAMKDFSHPGTSVKTPTDLNRAIESTTLVCRSEWKYVADLELDLAPGLPPVPCLPDELNQVILNLVINAAHAIAERPQAAREGKGRIRITTRAAEGCAQIAIEDSGCGIPEAIRSRIFDPFFTTKPVGKGTGQGLAIAYGVIVKQHGGAIELESEVGRGSTFTLSLPFQSRQQPETAEHIPILSQEAP